MNDALKNCFSVIVESCMIMFNFRSQTFTVDFLGQETNIGKREGSEVCVKRAAKLVCQVPQWTKYRGATNFRTACSLQE